MAAQRQGGDHMPSGTMTLRIDSRLESVRLIGWCVRGVCAATALDAAAIDGVELCVVEAASNAIVHAYAGAADAAVEVVVHLAPQQLTVAVRENGPGMDWAAARMRAAAYSADALAEGGRGLHLICTLMDTVAYERGTDGWNTLSMVKRLPCGDAVPARRR
jgi:anti-sigma regulatory factor (Ser/Thr protein kinase)